MPQAVLEQVSLKSQSKAVGSGSLLTSSGRDRDRSSSVVGRTTPTLQKQQSMPAKTNKPYGAGR